MKIPESQLRLITGDIGGSYGLRGSIYPEIILMLWAARRVGRPVKWLRPATKRTSATTTPATTSSMRRWRSTRTANSSACESAASAISAPSCRSAARCRRWSTSARSCGVYTTPALHVAISGMLTNTHCTSPYRGAGRPEASYMIERLIDIAADEMKIDPAELRRRNTIPPSAMPYKTPLTFTYDSGRFEENMDRAMKLGDWTGFEARRKEAARRGMLRGIGISNTIEQAADPTIETAEIRFDPLGGMTFVTGSISHGQGHTTIQTQMLVDRLGVDPERIKFIQGDTDAVAFGMGTGGSRSTTMSGGAIVMVSDKIIAKGKKLAAHILEASEARHGVQGRPLHHRRHRPRHRHPRRGEGGVRAGQAAEGHGARPLRDRDLSRHQRQFPERRHVCEVEIDPETGVTQLVGYCGGGRRRHRHQSDAGEGPDHGRHRAGHGPGADGGQGLRRRPAR